MRDGLRRSLGALALLSAVGCSDDAVPEAPPDDALAQQLTGEVARAEEAERVPSALVPATSCTDLLTRIQDDAIAKLRAQVEQAKQNPGQGSPQSADFGGLSGGALSPPTARPAANPRPAPSRPDGASNTNTQVEGIDEADFVKVVDGGKAIYLLHGSTLRRLKSWPPSESALEGKALMIEGTPSEMFVSKQGRAVIFSSVAGYGTSAATRGARSLKITVVDVSGLDPKTERELYYEGAYVSSRRYEAPQQDVVRTVVRSNIKYAGAFLPSIQVRDPWGRAFDAQEIAGQLADWERRTTASIRNTVLTHWLPEAFEVKAGKLERVEPNCDAYYVPPPGLADYGITQVLALDVAQPDQPVGGVTVLGGSDTVYSSAGHLVLAQRDYRFGRYAGPNRERTAMHVFELPDRGTRYLASGWVPGRLPTSNPQFGIDVTDDGTLRLATTGSVRSLVRDAEDGREYFRIHTESQVLTARAVGGRLTLIGQSPRLGHEFETVQSARFIGDRAYVVTYRQTDPLIVVDVSRAEAPSVLGEIEIPGFSQYIHPLDETHLITVGRSGDGGMQLQLFDVTTPSQIQPPKVLDFGRGTRSAVSAEHKAFTLFEGVLAIPVAGAAQIGTRSGYYATLQLVKVDAQTGFQDLGSVDHASLYADNGAGVLCGFCDASGCFDYSCPYEAEVRRGHFVKGGDKTYVYSFSNAGVLVNDLTALSPAVARIGLPAPIASSGPWYQVPSAPDPVAAQAADQTAVELAPSLPPVAPPTPAPATAPEPAPAPPEPVAI